MRLPFLFAKQILRFLGEKKRREFLEACKTPENVQKELKDKIIRNSIQPFPGYMTTYYDYAEKTELTREKVRFYETTSGSTGVKKEIPYTGSLLKSYENMFLLWAHDLLFHSGIKFKSGKLFMSVSPQIGEASNDDRKYLSPALSFLLSPFLASNPNDHKGKTAEDFFFRISRDLLKNRDLEVISIWSPTYLLSLLRFMKQHQSELGLETTQWEEVWPELKLISCWNEAQAQHSSKLLQEQFPNVRIQGKGLLSTEAPVSVPWSEANGCVPLLTETYLEFFDGNQLFKVHELEKDKTYTVVTSQMNGFLRYNTQDEVLVTGFYYNVPVLKFQGRVGENIDMAGEKISENLLRELFLQVSSPFLFVPDDTAETPGYVVYAEEDSVDWEKKLSSIHHYRLARELGQLAEIKVVRIRNLSKAYLDFYQKEGMNLGDIKERLLISRLSEARKFRAWIEKEYPSSH